MFNDVSVGEVTQSLLAIIVVLGGGALIAFEPSTREVVGSLVGLVLGFYFNRANGTMLKAKGEMK